MLRALVLVLALANLGWWLWHWPPAAAWVGLGDGERQPARLERQVAASAVQLLSERGAPVAPAASATDVDQGPASGAASAPEGPVCLEAGPMDDAGLATARATLQKAGVGPEAWVDIRRELPGSYGLYMGRFADAEQARRKSEELQRLNIPHEPAPASLAPGLLLGRYTDANQAQAALTRLQQRGVRTARVQTLVAPSAEHRLRIERAEPAALGLLAPEVKPAWRRCG